LGRSDEHTVYEGELVGMILATELIRRERRIETVAMGLDNQAAILAAANPRAGPGQYLVEGICKGIDRARNKHKLRKIKVRWTPGHVGIAGNEKADVLAKEAARGETSDITLLPPTLRE
ncbi:hypothetical protein BV22DRAFT_972243, partial [Leucogyrophana mollusca]